MPLSPADIGHRVVVRRLAGVRDGRPIFTDVLGVLLAHDETALAVRRSDGSTVRVPAAEVAAGRRVPPKPLRRSVRTLQEVADRSWPAVETAALGRWKLRASGGWTGRANSVLPLGDPGRPLDETLAVVRRWYAERELPARIMVAVEDPLDTELARRGWSVPADGLALVQTADIAAAAAALPASPEVRLDAELTERWLAGCPRATSNPDVARRVLAGPPETVFALAPEAAVGRAVADGQWLGISCVQVRRALRGQGHARRVLGSLLGWGRDRGARTAWLQVGAGNEPALRLYESAGFVTHHRYHLREAAP